MLIAHCYAMCVDETWLSLETLWNQELLQDIEDLPKMHTNCSVACKKIMADTLHLKFKDGSEWHKVYTIAQVLQILKDATLQPYILLAGNTARGMYSTVIALKGLSCTANFTKWFRCIPRTSCSEIIYRYQRCVRPSWTQNCGQWVGDWGHKQFDRHNKNIRICLADARIRVLFHFGPAYWSDCQCSGAKCKFTPLWLSVTLLYWELGMLGIVQENSQFSKSHLFHA